MEGYTDDVRQDGCVHAFWGGVVSQGPRVGQWQKAVDNTDDTH